MSKRKLSGKEIFFETIKYAFLIFLLLVFIVPILTVFFTAFKTGTEYTTTNVLQLPNSFLNLENFKAVFLRGNMFTGFKNTVIILVFSLIGAVFTGSMAAYIFSRFKTKFSKAINAMFLVAVVIPGVATQVATFQIISGLGLFNTRLAPILIYCGTDIMTIYIFLQFLENISVSLDESAIIDGANYFQIFFKIILPLLSPAIVTVLITKGVGVYNDFYTPFLYTPNADLLTLSTTLFKFKGPYGSHWEIISAGIIVIMIPTLIVFLTLQKRIYSGLVSGSVKE
jgi:ABC-type glycerol-3-phosphate transport system permease component